MYLPEKIHNSGWYVIETGRKGSWQLRSLRSSDDSCYYYVMYFTQHGYSLGAIGYYI